MNEVKEIEETLMNEKRGIRIELENGKYTFYSREDGTEVGCLRFGEPWVVFDQGSKALISLLSLLSEKNTNIAVDKHEMNFMRELLEEKDKRIKDLENKVNRFASYLKEGGEDIDRFKAHIKSLEEELWTYKAYHKKY